MAGRFDSTDIDTTARIDRERQMRRTTEVRRSATASSKQRRGTRPWTIGLKPGQIEKEWRLKLNNKVSVQFSPPKITLRQPNMLVLPPESDLPIMPSLTPKSVPIPATSPRPTQVDFKYFVKKYRQWHSASCEFFALNPFFAVVLLIEARLLWLGFRESKVLMGTDASVKG